LFEIGLFSYGEGTHIPLKMNSSVLEAGACSTAFPCEN
jgi:hypothetical protein